MNDEKFANLIDRVLDDALAAETVDFRLDALKVLSTYRIAAAKLSAKMPDDDEGGLTMGSIKARIAEAGGK